VAEQGRASQDAAVRWPGQAKGRFRLEPAFAVGA
jgi:hypothetical protein